MVFYTSNNRPLVRTYMMGRGVPLKNHNVMMKQYMRGSGIWDTVVDFAKNNWKTVGLSALPFLASWLFNRNKSKDQQVDPSQQLMNMKDRYSQYLPEEYQNKLDQYVTKDNLSILNKKPRPKRKPKPVEPEETEDDPEVSEDVAGNGLFNFGKGMSRKNKNMLKKLVKGSGIMKYN